MCSMHANNFDQIPLWSEHDLWKNENPTTVTHMQNRTFDKLGRHRVEGMLCIECAIRGVYTLGM